MSPVLVQIVRKIPHAVFIPCTFTITQEPESILRVILDVEVLTTHVLKTILEVQDATGIDARHVARVLAILIPTATFVCPDSTLEEFLRPSIIIINGFFLNVN